jgi:hypothetical protein
MGETPIKIHKKFWRRGVLNMIFLKINNLPILWYSSFMRCVFPYIPPLVERGLYCNHLIRLSVHPSVHTFVTDISASTGRNDFIFDIWLWHGDLYRLPFPGLPHIYFLFTVWITNERVGVFLARRSVQYLVLKMTASTYKYSML